MFNFMTELNGSLVEKDQEIALQRRQVEYWKDYRDRGQHDHGKQICLLEESITDLQETFETMSGQMRVLDFVYLSIKIHLANYCKIDINSLKHQYNDIIGTIRGIVLYEVTLNASITVCHS